MKTQRLPFLFSIIALLFSQSIILASQPLLVKPVGAAAASDQTLTPTAAAVFDGECLDSFDNFAYNTDTKSFRERWENAAPGPLPPWEEVRLPVPNSNERISWYGNPAIRLAGEQEEIWFTGYRYLTDAPVGSREPEPIIGVYQPATGDWHTLSGLLAGAYLRVEELHALGDGSMWGVPATMGRTEISLFNSATRTLGLPFLARFNEATQVFEAAPSVVIDDLPQFHMKQRDSMYFQNPVRTIAVDQQDRIWLFATPGGVYRYDPQDGSTQHVLSLVRVTDVSINVSGDFLFQASDSKFPWYLPLPLFQFSPFSQQLMEIATPPVTEFGRFYGSAFDAQGRIWLGSAGYRDTDGNWQLVATKLMGENDIYPLILDFASSDGRLWFYYADEGYPTGRAWYDPDRGVGCAFSKYSYLGGYAEDRQGFLWSTFGTEVYRLALDDASGQ